MSDVYIAQAQSANLSLILFLIKERARSSTHEGQKNNTGQRAIHQKVIGLRPQRIHPVERPAIGNEQLPIQPFAVLKGTRSYSPPKKRFSRKGLGVSTVCARTPGNSVRQLSSSFSPELSVTCPINGNFPFHCANSGSRNFLGFERTPKEEATGAGGRHERPRQK